MRALQSKRRSCSSAYGILRTWHSWSPDWSPGWSPSSGVTLGKRRLKIYIPILHCLVFRIRRAGAQNNYSGFLIFRLFTDLKLVNSVYCCIVLHFGDTNNCRTLYKCSMLRNDVFTVSGNLVYSVIRIYTGVPGTKFSTHVLLPMFFS